MGVWLQEFKAFISSLWDEWKVLVTGGTTAALLVIWGYVKGQSVASKTGLVFLAFTLLLAAFYSWRKQWRRADKTFVDIGPAALMKLRQGKTSPHAQAVLKHYIGRRILLTGTYRNLLSSGFGMGIVMLECEGEDISAPMSLRNARQFIPFPMGETVTVSGTITAVDGLTIEIGGVELLPNPSVLGVTA